MGVYGLDFLARRRGSSPRWRGELVGLAGRPIRLLIMGCAAVLAMQALPDLEPEPEGLHDVWRSAQLRGRRVVLAARDHYSSAGACRQGPPRLLLPNHSSHLARTAATS